jgi:hypothetical protein
MEEMNFFEKDGDIIEECVKTVKTLFGDTTPQTKPLSWAERWNYE